MFRRFGTYMRLSWVVVPGVYMSGRVALSERAAPPPHQYTMVRYCMPSTVIAEPGETRSVFLPFHGSPCVIGLYGMKDEVQYASIQAFDDRHSLHDISQFLRQFAVNSVTIIIFCPQRVHPSEQRRRSVYWCDIITTATSHFVNPVIRFETTPAQFNVEWVDLNKVINMTPKDHRNDPDGAPQNHTQSPVYFEIVLDSQPENSYFRSAGTNFKPTFFHPSE